MLDDSFLPEFPLFAGARDRAPVINQWRKKEARIGLSGY